MKPWVIRQIEELLYKTSFIKRNGSGNLFLADNGQYLSAMGNATLAVREFISTANNQIFDINVVGGYIYIVNSSSYTGTQVQLSSPAVGTQCTIKNSNAQKPITIITKIDGIENYRLDSHNAITVVYLKTGWTIIQAHLISYSVKDSISSQLKDLKASNGDIIPVDVSKSFTIAETDNRKFFNCTGNFTVYLPNCTTLPDGFNVYIKNASDGIITVSVSIADQKIDNDIYKEISMNETIQIFCAADKYVSSTTAAWIAPDNKT